MSDVRRARRVAWAAVVIALLSLVFSMTGVSDAVRTRVPGRQHEAEALRRPAPEQEEEVPAQRDPEGARGAARRPARAASACATSRRAARPIRSTSAPGA